LLLFASTKRQFNSYYEWLRGQFFHKRKLLEDGLNSIGVESIPSGGGFFLMGRLPQYSISTLESKLQAHELLSPNEPDDWKVCKSLSLDYGVTAIPASPFFENAHHYGDLFQRGLLARFAFCKKTQTLSDVVNRLKQAKNI
jgi:aspartate/methionine/tyrosine aminotransferase